MRVGIERHRDACVAQTFLNYLCVHAVAQELASMQVAEIMEPVTKAGLLTDRAPGTLEVR